MKSLVEVPRTVIPIATAALCTGCESVYSLTAPYCPACGSRGRLDLFKLLDWRKVAGGDAGDWCVHGEPAMSADVQAAMGLIRDRLRAYHFMLHLPNDEAPFALVAEALAERQARIADLEAACRAIPEKLRAMFVPADLRAGLLAPPEEPPTTHERNP